MRSAATASKMASVISLTERRAERHALETLPALSRAVVATNASSLRELRYKALIAHLREPLREILGWHIVEQTEIGVPVDLSRALAWIFGGDFSTDELFARAEQLRASIPKEAETLQRLLECPLSEFPGAERLAKDKAHAEEEEGYRQAIHLLELEGILLKAEREDLVTPRFAAILREKFFSQTLTQNDLWELIGSHARTLGGVREA